MWGRDRAWCTWNIFGKQYADKKMDETGIIFSEIPYHPKAERGLKILWIITISKSTFQISARLFDKHHFHSETSQRPFIFAAVHIMFGMTLRLDLYKSPKYITTHKCHTLDTSIRAKRTEMWTNTKYTSNGSPINLRSHKFDRTQALAQQWCTFNVCRSLPHKWIFVDEEKNNVCNSITTPF